MKKTIVSILTAILVTAVSAENFKVNFTKVEHSKFYNEAKETKVSEMNIFGNHITMYQFEGKKENITVTEGTMKFKILKIKENKLEKIIEKETSKSVGTRKLKSLFFKTENKPFFTDSLEYLGYSDVAKSALFFPSENESDEVCLYTFENFSELEEKVRENGGCEVTLNFGIYPKTFKIYNAKENGFLVCSEER